MSLPDVTREELINAMRRFDEERTSDEWRDWERDPNYQYAIVHDGRRYPPKRIVSLATGVPERSFSGGIAGANRYLEKRNLVVEPLRQEPLDGTRFAYLLAILDHVAKMRPANIDGVREQVSAAMKQLVATRGYATENYAESFSPEELSRWTEKSSTSSCLRLSTVTRVAWALRSGPPERTPASSPAIQAPRNACNACSFV